MTFVRVALTKTLPIALFLCFVCPMYSQNRPALHFTELLQAPAGTETTRASLRGKTVVLEFWGTWCVPCVLSIPKWNELVKATDPTKVVFISVSDESDSVIANFAKRRPILGWLGVDETDAMFKKFSVTDRPTTIVLDGNGQVVARTKLDELKPADLERMSKLTPTRAQSQASLKTTSVPAVKTTTSIEPPVVAPLFTVTIKPDQAPHASSLHGPNREGGDGWSSSAIWSHFAGAPMRRFHFATSLPVGTFSFYVYLPHFTGTQVQAMMRAAIATAFGKELEPVERTEDSFVLTVTPGRSPSLTETGSTMTPQFAVVTDGRLRAVNSTIDQVAAALEMDMDIPVVDETRITGHFDVDIPISGTTPEQKTVSIETALGIHIAKEKRKVTYYEVQNDKSEE